MTAPLTGTPGSCTIVLRDFVPDRRLTLNNRQHTHFRALMVYRDAAKTHLLNALWAVPKGGPPQYDRCHVTIEFVYPQARRRDPDGLAGLAKPLLDGLVDTHLLTDDDCAHIELTLRAVVEPQTTETRILITPLEDSHAQQPPVRPLSARAPRGAQHQ